MCSVATVVMSTPTRVVGSLCNLGCNMQRGPVGAGLEEDVLWLLRTQKQGPIRVRRTLVLRASAMLQKRPCAHKKVSAAHEGVSA